MYRRQFLTGLGAAVTAARAAGSKQVRLRIDPQTSDVSIPDDFMGLGYEISSVATKGLLTAGNRKYIQLVRTISDQGVIRIGGNTSDYSLWSPDGEAAALPKGTVTNKTVIDDLGGFLRATGWKLIWGLNVGTGTAESAADQAATVAKAAGDHLLCFELGNEPDLFARSGHRPAGYGYQQYHDDFTRFAAALRSRVPDAPLAGPDVAGAPDWVTSFAREEHGKIKLLTEHYYVTNMKNAGATMENMLKTDARFVNMTNRLRSDAESAGVPYRLVELNSFSGGGKPGVSDTFASALWGLDLMFTLASAGGAGINFETGVNHLGFISSYSPIFDDEHGAFTAHPLYYALLAFRGARGARLVHAEYDAGELNLRAYAFRDKAGKLWAALINKDMSTGAEVQMEGFASGELWRLSAPALTSTSGVTFAAAQVSAAGTWGPGKREKAVAAKGQLTVAVPAGSAVLVGLA